MTHEQVVITGVGRTRAGKKAIARVQCASYSLVNETSRNTIRKLLYNNLRAQGFDSTDIADEIEEGVYESVINDLSIDAPRFLTTYSMHIHRIVHAIKCSEYALEMIARDPRMVAVATSEELDPRASAADKQQINARLRAKISRKVSKLYRCGKCGCNEISVREYQSRASDEASSYSMQCLNESCANSWRT